MWYILAKIIYKLEQTIVYWVGPQITPAPTYNDYCDNTHTVIISYCDYINKIV